MEFTPGALASYMQDVAKAAARAQIKYMELREAADPDPLHLQQELRELLDRLDRLTEASTSAYAAAGVRFTEVRTSRGAIEQLARDYEIELPSGP